MYCIEEIKGIDCPKKFLISRNNKPVVFANTSSVATACLMYLQSGFRSELIENRVYKFLDKFKEEN